MAKCREGLDKAADYTTMICYSCCLILQKISCIFIGNILESIGLHCLVTGSSAVLQRREMFQYPSWQGLALMWNSLTKVYNRLIAELYTMKHQEVAQVLPFGVFEVTDGEKVVDYGIGVVHSGKLVTLDKFVSKGQYVGRVFFKRGANPSFPLSYDLSEQNHADYLVVEQVGNTEYPDGKTFIKIDLDEEKMQGPKFLSKRQLDQIDYGKAGYAVGFDKSEGSNIVLHRINYELDSHIMNLRIKEETGIIFATKEGKQYCYGFYDDSQDKRFGFDLFLSEQYLKGEQSQGNEAMIINNKLQAVEKPEQKVPFKSIGILKIPGGGYGTAELLSNSKGCKYLITCAHNFVGEYKNRGKTIAYNHLDKLGGYSYQLPYYPQSSTFKPLRYYMQNVAHFTITQVYIPQPYLTYFKTPEGYRPKDGKLNVNINTLYDIAIIELQNNLQETHGFTFQEERPLKDPVEVAGYPEGTQRGIFFGISQGDIYYQSTASHPGEFDQYVRLSEESNGNILMMHRISTLPGNSGSPIYERISNSSVRLLAIHTTGYGGASNITINTTKEDLYGLHNYGTYIYSPNIKKWLQSIPGLNPQL